MARSHTPASRASTTTPTAIDAQLDREILADQPADPAASPSEGPASSEPPGSSPSPISFRPLRWDDPVDARAWLDRVLTQVSDLAAVAREGARPSKHRVLSRSERSRQASTALRRLRTLFNAATAGLDDLSPPRGEPGE